MEVTKITNDNFEEEVLKSSGCLGFLGRLVRTV